MTSVTRVELEPSIRQARLAALQMCDRVAVIEPSVFADYDLVAQLGAGEDGVSYRAREVGSGSLVELRAIEKALSRPARRGEIAARLRLLPWLSHEAVADVGAVDIDREPAFIVVELASAARLDELKSRQSVSRTFALETAALLAAAVSEAHRLGLAHGSLDRSALRFAADGRLRLDFTGLSVAAPESDATSFRPPEIVAGGPATPEADIFALGKLISWILFDLPASAADWQPPDAGETIKDLERLSVLASDCDSLLRPTAGELAGVLDLLRTKARAQQIQAPTAERLRLDATLQLDAAIPRATSLSDTFELAIRPQSSPASASVEIGQRLGRYRILGKLGEGGMGAVFRAEDLGDGKLVAIKTIPAFGGDRKKLLGRLQKEARVLAAVNNPFVANFLEANEHDGVHYLAIEYVQGSDLRKLLAERKSVSEAEALAIMADVARALVDAHECGIVHRDIKPDNILLADSYFPPDGERSADGAANKASRRQVKLLDFGIARQINQTASLELTQAGAPLGTPFYMAPEQWKGEDSVTPQSDVYAFGATLFELLAGRPPFQGDDLMKIAAMHCFEAPVSLDKINPQISAATAAVVAKSLAKRPADRYADAGQLLAELVRLLSGEPAAIEAHPKLPAHDPKRLFRADFQWELESSPDALWPFVSDTDRLNRAVGLPSPQFVTENDPQRGVRKFGSFKLAGIEITWEEHPFEWIEGRRMGVLREFSRGPFKWFMSIVELTPIATGTRLRHAVRIEPRNVLGRLVAASEVKWKGRRNLERVYRRIDDTLRGKLGDAQRVDPFAPAATLPKARLSRLEQRRLSLVERGVDADLAGELVRFVREGSAQDLAKIRPIAWADNLGKDTEEVFAACLHADAACILTHGWDLLCPTCRAPSETKSSLHSIERHAHCEACQLDYDLDLGASVELVFRVHPEIRAFDAATYCVGGPAHAPHVAAQVRIAPGEQLQLDLSLPPGEYRLRGLQLPHTVVLRVQPTAASRCELVLDAALDPRRELTLRAGRQVLSITNAYPVLLVVRIERTIPRRDVLTAAQACASSLFRELFPHETLGREQAIAAASVTLMAVEVADVEGLYEQLADRDAYAEFGRRMSQVEAAVREARGAVVRWSGERLLAAFDDVGDAVSAAAALIAPAVERLVERETPHWPWRIGVHRGQALVTSANGRLDYFGSAARIVEALPSRAAAGEALFTETVTSDPVADAQMRILGLNGEPIQIELPGGFRLVQRIRRTSTSSPFA